MLIAGIDEVGRGCLAGPVVAACVVLPDDFSDSRIKDSKKLSAKKREMLYPVIMEEAVSVGIGVVCPIIIDKINILNATKNAMHLALSRVSVKIDRIIVDSVKLNNLDVEYIHPNKADDLYVQVSAASIIAKIYRDNLMKVLDKIYPEYKWIKNAGYGTAEHIDAINKYGITEIHRKSFLKNIKKSHEYSI